MNKARISNTLRRLGLLQPLDRLRFRVQQRKNDKENRSFERSHPEVVLPPDYLMYESFQVNYASYYLGGKETAEWVLEQVGRHASLDDIELLDWGCGPGRVIRHMPQLLPPNCRCYATDYNQASIEWCRRHIDGVTFNHNTLAATLPYADDSLDVVYGISILTHLSEGMHHDWYRELVRILKPGGILLLTTQGDNFRVKLSADERYRFDRGELVVRGEVTEGHRVYSAFHPDAFLQSLFGDLADVLEKIVTAPEGKTYLPQDAWLLRLRDPA